MRADFPEDVRARVDVVDPAGRTTTYQLDTSSPARLTGVTNPAQFTVLDSELDKPMGDVSGFWLTWHWLGYSKVYGSLIALASAAKFAPV